jgi:hypothetical protein
MFELLPSEAEKVSAHYHGAIKPAEAGRKFFPEPNLAQYTADQARYAIATLYVNRARAVCKAIRETPEKAVSLTDLKSLREATDRLWGGPHIASDQTEEIISALATRAHALIDAQQDTPEMDLPRLDQRLLNLLEHLTIQRDIDREEFFFPTSKEHRQQARREAANEARDRARDVQARNRRHEQGKFSDAELKDFDVTPWELTIEQKNTTDYKVLYKRSVLKSAIKQHRWNYRAPKAGSTPAPLASAPSSAA